MEVCRVPAVPMVRAAQEEVAATFPVPNGFRTRAPRAAKARTEEEAAAARAAVLSIVPGHAMIGVEAAVEEAAVDALRPAGTEAEAEGAASASLSYRVQSTRRTLQSIPRRADQADQASAEAMEDREAREALRGVSSAAMTKEVRAVPAESADAAATGARAAAGPGASVPACTFKPGPRGP